jgi:hypothetical protein
MNNIKIKKPAAGKTRFAPSRTAGMGVKQHCAATSERGRGGGYSSATLKYVTIRHENAKDADDDFPPLLS